MQGRGGATHHMGPTAAAFILFFAAAFAITPALAVGGDSGSRGSGNAGGGAGGAGGDGGVRRGGGTRSMDMTTCMRGEVWDRRVRKCVRMRSEVLPDEILIDYSYALARAERFEEALDTLSLVQDSNTPEALNYRGYATRKLGRTEEGITYYRKAIELDPQYAQVREYLGEAYVALGNIDLAKEQLSAIERLCGTECEEYKDLAEVIETAPTP